MEEESMRDNHTKNVWKTPGNYFISLLKYIIIMDINIKVATIINWEEILTDIGVQSDEMAIWKWWEYTDIMSETYIIYSYLYL